jgi:hypothetical protein
VAVESASTGATSGAPARRGRSSLVAFTGVALLVVGLGLWVVSRLLSGTEPHSYAGGVAPATVDLVRGDSYALAIRGGVPAEQHSFVSPASLRCSASSASRGAVRLAVRPESADTKAINQIGTFFAPMTGRFHVQCVGLSDVFVDDAANAPGDTAGLVLVLAVFALAIGAPLTLSAVRRSVSRPREQQQVE